MAEGGECRHCRGFTKTASLWSILESCVLHQIITTEEAERRGVVYDKQGVTYLFDLDYVDDVYTIEAARYGNISHFVNHSVSTN
ncbi:histone-lysine N-methyltransferase SUV39H1-A-like [Sinocyclocheilus grahami]|uniref:histone-lysine N-methyltransferase SUV39H1-A-like n=1 Tax=Sinocyclocheilus grahami TaxID=75366 RepID=UPI0007AD61A6|nr:PREDICTED: histone-lysine N-methyltransferase SUV39H1-A-like [Sinocyclocheilus grahami]